jgi:DNA-binding transcriptional regulator GbsR (MarR family)
MAEGAEAIKERKRQEYNDHPDVKKWNSMTPEQRTRKAIDRTAKAFKENADWRSGGKDTSYEAAREKAEKLANTEDRKKSA